MEFDYLNSPLSASAFDALGPAHQNAKHGHDKQSQDYYKENFTYLDHNQSPSEKTNDISWIFCTGRFLVFVFR